MSLSHANAIKLAKTALRFAQKRSVLAIRKRHSDPQLISVSGVFQLAEEFILQHMEAFGQQIFIVSDFTCR